MERFFGRGSTWYDIQSNPLPFLQLPLPFLPLPFLSLTWISDVSWDGNKPWGSWKNHSRDFVFIPLITHSPISFIAYTWRLTVFPGVAGCSHEVGRATVAVGILTGGHAWGNPDWSLEEWRQFQGEAAIPGHQVYIRASSHLSLDGDSRIQSLPTCLLLLTLVSCFYL